MNKKCTKCHREFPATKKYFSPNRQHKDGLQSHCKKCKNIISAIWRKNNREKHNQNQREYHKTLRGYVSYLVSYIKTRCTNKKHLQYKDYGGRGICCLFTSGDLYSWLISSNINPRGLEIHRIDNDGNYNLNNITFLSKSKHMELHHSQNREA